MVERWSPKPHVAGSTPATPANLMKGDTQEVLTYETWHPKLGKTPIEMKCARGDVHITVRIKKRINREHKPTRKR